MAAATRALPALPSCEGAGLFLENGARFYLDAGSHPEMTTPECLNPWDAVRYVKAGDRNLLRVREALLASDSGVREVLLFRTNVDAAGSGNTWGCHASFLHRSDPMEMPPQIIPHLVSRLIYSGAGGVEFSRQHPHFTLSPRVRFLNHEVSASSTGDRGIFHMKDESLGNGGYHRLHIICGESVCSELSLWLNMGATALVVALVEMGARPGDGVRLVNPLGAMRRFARDPFCQARVPALDGRMLRAVDIQRHYLELALRHATHPLMPPWAGRICAAWGEMLDRIEQGAPDSVSLTLDWAIKHALFTERAARRGVRLGGTGPRRGARPGPGPDGTAPPPERRRQAFQELCEIDTRFGQVGAGGVFEALDRAGVLRHRVDGVDNIEHAMTHPPATGRARIRGECVRRFAGERSRYSCGWVSIHDRERGLVLDLSDPFAATETWKSAPPRSMPARITSRLHFRQLLQQAGVWYLRGHLDPAVAILEDLLPVVVLTSLPEQEEYHRLRASVLARLGLRECHETLDRAPQARAHPAAWATAHLTLDRWLGLVPPATADSWLSQARAHAAQEDPDIRVRVGFLSAGGHLLMKRGRTAEGRAMLEEAAQPGWRNFIPAQLAASTLADLGEACRVTGDIPLATALLQEAGSLQVQHQLGGDQADLTLSYLSKLTTSPEEALEHLASANRLQIRGRSRVAQIRSRLLEARWSRQCELEEMNPVGLRQISAGCPALMECPLYAKILGHWQPWVEGAPDPEGGDDPFWGL
jgi:proteasome accessory factor A